MKNIFVTYDSEIVSNNSVVDPRGCTSISFENIGVSNALLDAAIPLNPGDPIRDFNNTNPNEVIKKSFPLSFTGAGAKSVLVIRKFTEIKQLKDCK